MTENILLQFQGKKYINIETYRKSGEAVKTPVWFVEENGVLYVRTGAESGKVKRLRRNAQVKIVPCSMGGDPQGTWVPASADLITDEWKTIQVEGLLKKKYGLQKAVFDLFGRRNKGETATVKFQFSQ